MGTLSWVWPRQADNALKNIVKGSGDTVNIGKNRTNHLPLPRKRAAGKVIAACAAAITVQAIIGRLMDRPEHPPEGREVW